MNYAMSRQIIMLSFVPIRSTNILLGTAFYLMLKFHSFESKTILINISCQLGSHAGLELC